MEFFRPEYLVEIVVRRKWYLIIPLIIAMLLGIYFALTLPKVYRAQTLILVQPQKVPANFVQSIVTSTVESRLRTISEQIMSITNIERIIRNFNLFTEPQYKDMYWEDKANQVRRRISLSVSKGNTFSVSFTGKDPKTVMEVTNALASYFIDENLKVREAQAINTSAFLDDELTGVKNKLKATEKILMDFRKKNMGTLPEQLGSNLKILEQLQSELRDKEDRLVALQENLIRLETTKKEFLDGNLNVKIQENPESEDNKKQDLETLKSNYQTLRTRYTDKHPDVIKLGKIIQLLEGNLPEEALKEDPKDEILARFGAKRAEMEKQVAELKEDTKKIKTEIAVYQNRIEKTPETEQELIEINRNYGNIRSQYNSLLNRSLESEIAVNMEKKQKGEQFRIIDPAKMPEKPYEPDLNKLFLIFIVAGGGIGAAMIFVMEYFDSAFRRAEEIEPYLKMPVLAYMPKISTKEELWKQKIQKTLAIVPIAGAAVLFGLFVICTIKASDATYRIVEKLGVVKAVNTIEYLIQSL